MNSGSTKTILVTGAAGFVGQHLVAELIREGHTVVATVRAGQEGREGRWLPVASNGADSRGELIRETLQLPDPEKLEDVLRRRRPDAVVHLGAVSFVPDCERDSAGALVANVDSTRSVMETLNRVDHQLRTIVVFPSTSHVYGAGADEPLDESSRLDPGGVYARTKLAAEFVAQVLASGTEGDRPLVLFRAFNHAGPGQDHRFVISSFARQFARIQAGLQAPELRVGNIDVRRDFTDVRDVARAYRLAVEGRVPPGVYNLASGRAVAIREVIAWLQDLVGRPVKVVRESARLRGGEIPKILGDSSRLRRACGWEPRTPLVETVRDTLQWWRDELRK